MLAVRDNQYEAQSATSKVVCTRLQHRRWSVSAPHKTQQKLEGEVCVVVCACGVVLVPVVVVVEVMTVHMLLVVDGC